MRKHLLTIVLLILAITTNAENIYQNEEIVYKNSLILIDGKEVAKYNSVSKEISVSTKEKTTIYEVSIIKEDGKPLAKFDLQISENLKKNNSIIVQASLKTLIDNISHNSANFLVFDASKITDEEIPQFDKVIKYLISYHYL